MRIRKTLAITAVSGLLLSSHTAFAQEASDAPGNTTENLENAYLTPEDKESAAQEAKKSDNGSGSWAVKPKDTGEVEIGLSGVEFRNVDSHVEIVDKNGATVEKLVDKVTLESGEEVGVQYSVNSKSEATMKFINDNPITSYKDKPRWRCYTDAINGGAAGGCIGGAFFGGVGCGPGALAGMTGGLANAAFSCSD